jgi:RNA polymerase sigma-70 factor (TIGR02960 family)
VDESIPASDAQLLAAARGGGSTAFEELVAPYRRELFAHCHRMLGSFQDAEDALQESLVAAWRGLSGFQGRSSLRAWLYRIATNACLRLISRRPRRILSPDFGPPRKDTDDLGEPVTEPIWLEPWPDDEPTAEPDEADPAARLLRRETVELAFLAALQFLPGTQRAVLLLRDVLAFSAAETAAILDTTPASVNSALQRARKAVDERVPATTQHEELAALGEDALRELVDAFVAAWEGADIAALTAMLADDARFTMPPLPAWFDGRDDVGRFFAERVFATRWRLVPLRANGQLGFAAYWVAPGADRYTLSGINLLSVRSGRIAWIASFLDPALHRRFDLAPGLPEVMHPTDR